jgi:hypothetical protein
MAITPGQIYRDGMRLHSAIRRLRKMGLDEGTARKLDTAGPTCGGLELAEELLAAGPETVREVARLATQEEGA